MASSTQPDRRKVDIGHPTERRRGRRRLSRERVLAAALDVVDREGLSALSMRRVAAELDVEAMALYRYAPSKDALLDGLVEQLYMELHEDLAREEPAPSARRPICPNGVPNSAATPAPCTGSPSPTRRSCRCWPRGCSPSRWPAARSRCCRPTSGC